jgi:proteasome accessory factor B
LTEPASRELALIDLRKGKAAALRALATSSQSLGEWDRVKVPIFNAESLCSIILWHGEDAMVQEPNHLRNLIVKKLENLVKAHG